MTRVSRARLAAMRADPHLTTDDIAAALGVHRSSVAQIAQRLGLPRVKDGPKPRVPREPFASLWLAGVSAREIAAQIGVTRNYTTTLARRFGLPPRRQGAQPKATLHDLAQAALARGMAQEAAATRAALAAAEMVDVRAGNWRTA